MREDWKYWIALERVKGIGDVSIKNLFSQFQGADSIFKASKKELIQVDGISDKQIQSIKNFNDWDDVEKELEKIEKRRIKVTSTK